MPVSLISPKGLIIAALAGLVGARVDLGGGHRGLAMAGTSCSGAHQIACTELDDDWPDMGLACPRAHHDIPRHTLAMMSATIIQLGHYKHIPPEQFPSHDCYTTPPNATTVGYGFISQGSFDMWFFAHDKCTCEAEQMPECGISATAEQKCNLRTFTLCKVTKKTEICEPKHHSGWKPIHEASGITQAEGREGDKQVGEDKEEDNSLKRNDTMLRPGQKFRFNPSHRQQLVFPQLSNIWWSIMEFFGFWGAI
ncbi:hypothetical protein PCANC_07151 [Puccinia coronata f. sp. avenae]|uniref:Uncharacterized protein n=1 Tax=Puccinia coronata f. sp. avenae TaxID=200324 RepID=A0A2N5T2I6_9BASI|nr:hypothetical protein PCANC_07151 [Puccinia coronata f. sp. avenae]PLW19700.1 hypothetical protein PCASD_13176 [Puccinia coronata f. sp. avenae]